MGQTKACKRCKGWTCSQGGDKPFKTAAADRQRESRWRPGRHHSCGLVVREVVPQEGTGNNKTLMTYYEFIYKTGCTVAKIAVR